MKRKRSLVVWSRVRNRSNKRLPVPPLHSAFPFPPFGHRRSESNASNTDNRDEAMTHVICGMMQIDESGVSECINRR